MSDATKIEWTRGDDGAAGATWNPVTGCTKVSEGCDHCYAETFAERWRGVSGHPFEQGFDVRVWPERLTLPLQWRKGRRVFLNSMSDLWLEAVGSDLVAAVFAVMAVAQQHTFQVLTKRAGRMQSMLGSDAFWDQVAAASRQYDPSPEARAAIEERRLPNLWLGVSVESQKWAAVRLDKLAVTTAGAVRFVSCEPLLGDLDLRPWLSGGLDWVIVGGESGPGARPMHPRWARSLREQCKTAGVPFFFKQWGAWTDAEHGLDAVGDDDPLFRRCTGNNRANGHRMQVLDGTVMVRLGKGRAGRVLDGRTWDQFPEPRLVSVGHG